jgi:cbb3-type cytochrome oxidase subunit 3
MRAFFARSLPDNPWLLLFLLAFCAVFCAVALWQYRPSKRAEHAALAQIPFQD